MHYQRRVRPPRRQKNVEAPHRGVSTFMRELKIPSSLLANCKFARTKLPTASPLPTHEINSRQGQQGAHFDAHIAPYRMRVEPAMRVIPRCEPSAPNSRSSGSGCSADRGCHCRSPRSRRSCYRCTNSTSSCRRDPHR